MKNLLVLMSLALIMNFNTSGQSFSAQEISQFGVYSDMVYGMSVSDLDNDSRKDFIIYQGASLDVYIDKPERQPVKQKLSSSKFYNGIAFDYNDDGLVDIVGVGETINFYMNTGNGNFISDAITKVDTSVTFSYRHIDTLDLNNDNMVDIVISVLNSDANRYYCFVLYNKGNGVFSRPYNVNISFFVIAGVSSSQYTVKLKILDYNNNGTSDIGFITSSNGAKILSNNGNNTFTVINNTSLNNDMADIDNDGDYDSYFVDGSNLFVNINTGVSFNNKFIGNVSDVRFTKFVDVDGDSRVDILCGKYMQYYERKFNDNIFYFKNINGVDFVKTLIDSTVNNPYKDAFVSDINNDGRNDVVGLYMTSGCMSNNYSIVKYAADSIFYKKEWFVQLGTYDYYKWVDIDNDRLPDYVYNFGNNSKLFWLKNKGRMQFDKPRVLLDSLPFQNCLKSTYDLTAVNFDDLNNDGLDDIYGCLDGKFFSSVNLGNQKYAPYSYIDSASINVTYASPVYSPNFNNVLFLDINDDGVDDILYVTSYSLNKVYYSISLGEGKFSKMYLVSNPLMKRSSGVSFTLDLKVIDIDNDGRKDLLYYPVTGDNSIFWFKNNGNTTFTEKYFYNNTNGIIDNTQLLSYNDIYVNISYVNSDNFYDLISNHKWMPSQSNGKYAPLRPLINNKYLTERMYRPDFYDLNNDGHKDLIIHNFHGPNLDNDSLLFHKGIGNGVFDSVPRFIYKKSFGNTPPLSYTKMYLDIDDDGDLDISFVENLFLHRNLLVIENKLNDNNTINVQCYWDKNQNKVWDNGEPPMGNQKIYLDVNSEFAVTNDSGLVSFHLFSTGSHNVRYKSNSLWKPTTDSIYHILLPQDTVKRYLIGLKPNNLIDSFIVSLTSSPSRCQRNSNLWISVNNLGNTIINGADTLKINSLLKYNGAIPAAQNIDELRKYWNISNLNPSSRFNILADITNPDVVAITDSAKIQTYFSGKSNAFSQYKSSIDTYESSISCSFDPNYKTVKGVGINKDSFTLKTNPIEYTIHFQNTGNDTAYKVVIFDTIDVDLDINSILILSSSHNANVNIKNNVLIFEFNNINLVDSFTNERLSHGYIRFRILPKPNIPNHTIIKNNADIVFDLNQAIKTNTTQIILVDSLLFSFSSYFTAGVDKIICAGQLVTLTASAASSYSWNNGEKTASIVVSPNNTTSYIVTGTVNNVSKSDTVIVQVKPLPNVAFTKTQNGAQVQFSAPGGNTSYHWSFGDTTTSTQQNPLHTYTKNGKFYVTLTAGLDGCTQTKTDSVSITITAITNQLSVVDKIQIAPNPVAQFLSLDMEAKKATDFNVTLLNVNGQVVFTKIYNKTSVIHDMLDTHELSSGVYLLQIQAEGEQAVFRIIKK